MFKGQNLPNLHTSSIHLASSLKASGHWESHQSTSNPSTLSWWRRMRLGTGWNLGGSVRLYCEMAPQTATLPNVFMFASTVSNHSPPTWGERDKLTEQNMRAYGSSPSPLLWYFKKRYLNQVLKYVTKLSWEEANMNSCSRYQRTCLFHWGRLPSKLFEILHLCIGASKSWWAGGEKERKAEMRERTW